MISAIAKKTAIGIFAALPFLVCAPVCEAITGHEEEFAAFETFLQEQLEQQHTEGVDV